MDEEQIIYMCEDYIQVFNRVINFNHAGLSVEEYNELTKLLKSVIKFLEDTR